VKELFSLSGYVRGGCSPIGMKKKYPVYIGENILLHDTVFVSAGLRGLQFKIKSADAKTCDLIM
jgi:Cys-tRNA(Pro)/Cys-tRNA(Cys) deacylase